MKQFLISIFLITSISCYSQEPTLSNLLEYIQYAKQKGQTHTHNYINALYLLAEKYRNMNDCSNYILTSTEAYSIGKDILPDSEELAHIAATCAYAYMACDDYGNALTYMKYAYSIFHSKNNKGSEAMISFILASIYTELEDNDEEEKYLQCAYNLKEYLDENTIANILYSLWKISEYKYDYVDALKYSHEYYDFILKTKGEKSVEFYFANGLYGKLLVKVQHYKEAEPYLLKNANLSKQKFEEYSEVYATSLNDLGLLYFNLGNLDKALQYYNEALQVSEQVSGKHSLQYAAILLNYAHLQAELQYMDKAEQILLTCLEINRSHMDEPESDTLMCINHLMGIKIDKQQYAQAEELGLVILSSTPTDEIKCSTLNNMSILYLQMGNRKNALQYQIEACDLSAKIYGKKSPMYATALNNLAGINTKITNFLAAENQLIRSLEIKEQTIGTDNYAYIVTLGNIGTLYNFMDEYEKSVHYHSIELELCKKLFGENVYYANALNDIAVTYHLMGNDFEAEKYHKQAIAIYRNNKWLNSSAYPSSLETLATLYDTQHKFRDAEKLFNEASEIRQNQIKKQFLYMTELQRSNLWETVELWYTSAYPSHSYLMYKENTSTATLFYDNILFSKGVLLSEINIIHNTIYSSHDKVLINKWTDLQQIQNKLLRLHSYSESNDSKEMIDSLENICEQAEKEISKLCVSYRTGSEKNNINWVNVKQQLKDNEVAIEFISFSYFVDHWTDSTMYCALLLRHNSKYPEMIPLFEEKEISPLIHTSTGNQPNSIYSYGGNGAELTKKVWSKILPYIRQGETVYFSPSGLLHQLAIEALPYDETHTMADMYNLVRLSSTREIVTHKDNIRHTTATLYGGIQYDVNTDELLAESEAYNTTDLLASRGIINDTIDRGSVKYLKGTKQEVEHINQMLQNNYLQVQLFTSTAANEESFKALSGKHQNILHIATHGFFWEDSTAHKKDYFAQRMFMSMGHDMPTPPTIDPLNRCGLLFAGANTALQGYSADLPEGVQDGVLTAKEISLLDLRDADLVVLSACETGKGEITGDGVFGLQRAFKQAGAQTIIMSLWPVNDNATQMLMTEFYTNWIEKKQSKREAFRNAQNAVRYAVDEYGDRMYADPVYWAGFIMLD